MQNHIIFIDGDEDTCLMVKILLAHCGYKVTLASTAIEGLSLIRANHYDLYLLNDGCADATGLEVCRQIRSFNSHIPILFYSAQAYETDRQKAFHAGAQGYLIKPNGTFQLVETIARLIKDAGVMVANEQGDLHPKRIGLTQAKEA